MNVKTAARTLDLFEVFANAKKPLNLSELAHELKIPVSSCFALVRTLENRGYLYMLAARKDMYPTKRLLNVAQAIAANDPILDRLEPILSKLRDTTDETAVLSKRQGDHIVFLDVYDSRNSIRYNPSVGEFKMLHTSSAGKAFLGALDDDNLDRTLRELTLTRLTPNTLTRRKALYDDIIASRKRGWYCNMGESVTDLIGIALTVVLGAERYAISVAGPVYRMKPRLDQAVEALLQAKESITAAD